MHSWSQESLGAVWMILELTSTLKPDPGWIQHVKLKTQKTKITVLMLNVKPFVEKSNSKFRSRFTFENVIFDRSLWGLLVEWVPLGRDVMSNNVFLNGSTRPICLYFHSYQIQFNIKIVVFSEIRTLIVWVEGDTMTTWPRPERTLLKTNS